MKETRRRLLAYISAAVLACLTLSVFYKLQDYGPESAIRRFNEAILNDDRSELQQVTKDPVDSGQVRQLIGQLKLWFSQGYSMQIGLMERGNNQVRAAVVFSVPNGTPVAMVWVVERVGKVWLVNADKTATILRDAFGE